jgi:hypothetical protein
MCFPSVRLIWADQSYSGTLVTWAAASLNIIMTRRLARYTNRPQTKAT